MRTIWRSVATLASRLSLFPTAPGLWRRHAVGAAALLALWLSLPTLVQAQFSYVTNNGALTITGYSGIGEAVTVPGAIDGLPVTSIGDKAFGSCTNLTNVTIPASITSIGQRAAGILESGLPATACW